MGPFLGQFQSGKDRLLPQQGKKKRGRERSGKRGRPRIAQLKQNAERIDINGDICKLDLVSKLSRGQVAREHE